MSKKAKDADIDLPEEQESKEEAIVEEPLPDTAVEPEPEPEPEPAKAVRKGSGGVAWLAVVLALLALASVAYMQVQDWRAQSAADQSATSLADLRDRFASSRESLESLDRGLSELAAADAQAASDLERLQSEINQRIQMLDSLPSRVSNLEGSLSTLQGVSTGARDTWLLAEAEYYMQIANAQLQLAGNPHLASLALAMADERIVQLSNPALTDVRRALADELAALEVMEKPDIEGVTLTLASLARVVDSLPFQQGATTEADDDAELDPEMSGLDRAWASVKGAASGLVRVTGPDESATALMTPEAAYFLRTNLTLQLQAARLALLRGEQSVFQQSLDDASAWLDQYYDTQSEQVSSAQQTITEIRDAMFAVSTPDISESLRLLRQYETLAGSAQ
jgi:uroporphyrin-3 C-methyltransferase